MAGRAGGLEQGSWAQNTREELPYLPVSRYSPENSVSPFAHALPGEKSCMPVCGKKNSKGIFWPLKFWLTSSPGKNDQEAI